MTGSRGLPPVLAAELRRAREAQGLTQAAVGDAVGVSAQSVRAYERAWRMPSRPVALALIRVLGIDGPVARTLEVVADPRPPVEAS